MKNITFQEEGFKFNFRVAAFFVCRDKVLVQNAENDNYFSLIGGRVQLGETTLEAIKREVEEEIGFAIDNKEIYLTRVCENFFEYHDTKFHEILYIYLVEFGEEEEIARYDFIPCKDKENVKMIWIDKNELTNVDLRPAIAKEIMKNQELQHIIIK